MMERGIGDMLGRIADLEHQVERMGTRESPGGGTEYLLTRTVLAGVTQFIDFVQIPQTGRRLIVRWDAKGDLGGTNTNDISARFSTNTTATPTPDTGNNYCYTSFRGNNAAATSGNATLGSILVVGLIGGGTSPSADYLSSGKFEVMNYTHTSNLKTVFADGYHHGTTSGAASYRDADGGDWHGGAIYQVRLFSNGGGQFIAGSIFELWIG